MVNILILIFVLLFSCNSTNTTKMDDNLLKISDNLYLYKDCCNVYVIKDNDEGILIDFGSGGVLKYLPETGIKRIKAVLVTHHHRDQIQGLVDLENRDFKVYIPEKEIQFIPEAEEFWKKAHIYVNYNLRSHFHTVRKNIPETNPVREDDVINPGNYNIKVLETPGHTDGAVSYIANVDGKTVVFTNDLISAPGKVTNYYDLHWDYSGYTQGMSASLKSFEKIKNEHPGLLLPSHGKPIKNAVSAIEKLEERFDKLMKMVTPNNKRRTSNDMFSVSKHIVYLGNTSYALVSDSKRAIIYDFGYIDLSRIREFIRKYNIKNIDAVTYSHYHDDHIMRTNELLYSLNWHKRIVNTQVWISEVMVDVLENPTRYKLPCLIPFPIKADRIIKDKEIIEWEGLKLHFFHMPGQTSYHQGMMLEDEGKKYLFSGDNIWHPADGIRPMNSPIIPGNRYFINENHGYLKISKDLIDMEVDIIVPSHYFPFSVTREELDMYRDWAKKLTELYKDIIDQPDANMGMDHMWISFYPYRIVVNPEEKFEAKVSVTNHLDKPSEFVITLKHSENIVCDYETRTVNIPPNSTELIPFAMKINSETDRKREIICADITMNGTYLGEYTEMVVDVE